MVTKVLLVLFLFAGTAVAETYEYRDPSTNKVHRITPDNLNSITYDSNVVLECFVKVAQELRRSGKTFSRSASTATSICNSYYEASK